ncbi:MAG: DUF433 domain-containing protein [Acidobacteria bacterium]|nr:DUF433 domain-containing protein [Acidobacteriota bacterium]
METLIEINPRVMVGKPVIKGTRITVELVLEKLAAGQSVDDILRSYPHLNRNQILACLEYAYKSMSVDFVFPVVHKAA